MHETEELLAAWKQAANTCVLATVVKTAGSTYRRAGARMLVGPAGRLAGAVSGGCLERDLVRKAWWLTEGGRTALFSYNAITDEDDPRGGFGLGCNGVTTVLLERVDPPPAESGVLAFLAACLGRRCRGAIATVIGAPDERFGARLYLREDGAADTTLPHGDGELAAAVARDAREALQAGRHRYGRYPGGLEIFFEAVSPPRALTVFGGGPDVPALVQAAQLVGWHGTAVDARAADQLPPDLELGADAAAVIMTHNFDRDRALLDRLLPSALGYLGLLGPRARTEALLARLTATPTAAHLARLHAPVGLDIGAEGAQQIALAIVAEVQAFFAGRPGGPRSRAP
jgi:xanthine/CO dehydrogenase XdhC/CoxF family maturation factor